MDNFLPLMKLLHAARGIRQVRALDELAPAIAAMLDDPAAARAEADRGRAALAQHHGATAKTVAAIAAEAAAR
jgi:3-deoxy-D-manno-octulosonic-acid transferase